MGHLLMLEIDLFSRISGSLLPSRYAGRCLLYDYQICCWLLCRSKPTADLTPCVCSDPYCPDPTVPQHRLLIERLTRDPQTQER